MSADRSSNLGNGAKSDSNINSNKHQEGENSGLNRFRNQPRGSPRPDSNPTAGGPTNDGGIVGDGDIGPRFAGIGGGRVSRRHTEEEDESGSLWSGEEAVEGVGKLSAEPKEADSDDGVDSDGGDIDGKAQEEDYHQDELPGAGRAQRWSPPTPANVHDPDAGFRDIEHADAEDGERVEGSDNDETKESGTVDSANGYSVDRGSNINSGGTQSRHFRPQPEDDAQRNEGPMFSDNRSDDKVGALAGDGDLCNRDTHEPLMQLPQDDESLGPATQQCQRSALQSTPLPRVRSMPPEPPQEPHLQQEQKQDQTQQQTQQQQTQQQRTLSSRKEDEEEEEAEEESRDITASNSDLFALFGADSEVHSAATPSSSDVSALFGAGRGEVGGDAGVDSSCDAVAVSSSHFDHSGSRRSSVAVSSIYSESDVDDGRDHSNHGSSRSFAVSEQRDLDGCLNMMRAASGVDRGGDEDGGEDQNRKQKREERQAIFRRRVGDGFLTLANCYLTASGTIRGVEAEQREMLQEEESIQQGLVKFGKRVLEAAHTMETRLQAAFAGDDDSGMEERLPPTAPLNPHGRTGKADKARNTGDAGKLGLGDRAQLAATPRDDGFANSTAAGVAVIAPRSRGGGSGEGDSEWPSSQPVETGAFGTFNDSNDNYNDGERFPGGVVRRGRKFNSNLTGKDRNQDGSSTEEATSVGGSQNIRTVGDMAVSASSSGASSRPSSSSSKRPRFNAVGGHQVLQLQRDGSSDAYMFGRE